MNRRTLGLSFLLIATTCLAYWPAYRGRFIWDDDRYVWQNTLLRSGRGLVRIWTDVGATPQYYPLTHTVFWLQWHAWGDRVIGYHVVSVLLHIVASLLVVRLLKELKVRGAWLAGFAFALHPLHVESVAWISELKNTLSIVFWLLATLAYASYAGLRHRPARQPRQWFAAFGLFLAAVLSKTVSSSMPAVMLVLIAWKRRHLRWRDVRALLPFFAVAIIASTITGQMERAVVGAEGHDWDLTFAQRTLIAGRAVWWYVTQLVWPHQLAFSYVRWSIDAHDPRQWMFVVATVLIIGLLIGLRKKTGNGAIAAALIFCGTLFPALGFFNLFPHRYSFVADHFQYASDIALIALFCAALVGVGKRITLMWRRAWTVSFVLLLAIATFAQARIYRDEETLWRDTVTKTPTSWLAHNNLAICLLNSSDPSKLDEALFHLNQVERLRPEHDRVHWTKAGLLVRLGRMEEANREFDIALKQYRDQIAADPKAVNPYIQLAGLQDRLGRSVDAAQTYALAATNRPDQQYFQQQAAQRLLTNHQDEAAIPFFQQWALLRPDAIEPRVRLAYLYGASGRVMEARLQLQKAAKIDPDNAEVVRGFQLIEAWISHRVTTSPSHEGATPRPPG